MYGRCPVATKSSFQRRDGDAGTVVFEVRPARGSIRFMILTIVSFFVLVGVLWVITALIGELILGGLPGLVTMVLGVALAITFFWFIEWRHAVTSHRYREPVTLTISDQGLSKDGHLYPIQEIAELKVSAPGKAPDNRLDDWGGPAFVGTDFVSAAASGHIQTMKDVSRGVARGADSIRRLHANRSFVLTIRTKRSSEAEVIAGGLTPECARALAQDLGELLRTRVASVAQEFRA